VTCRLGKRDLSNVFASIRQYAAELRSPAIIVAAVVASAGRSLARPPRFASRVVFRPMTLKNSADVSKFYGANEAQMPQLVAI
jgi:hypothetical protein